MSLKGTEANNFVAQWIATPKDKALFLKGYQTVIKDGFFRSRG